MLSSSGPSPAWKSIGAAPMVSEATDSGSSAATIAASQPPWQSPIRCTGSPMWAIASRTESTYSTIEASAVAVVASSHSITNRRSQPAARATPTWLWRSL